MGPEGLPVQAKRLNTTGSPRGLGFPHYSWKSGCEGWLARSSSTRWGGGEGSAATGEGSQREDGEPRSPAPSPNILCYDVLPEKALLWCAASGRL